MGHKKKYLLYIKTVTTRSAFELSHGNTDLYTYDHNDEYHRAKYAVCFDLTPWTCLGWATMADIRWYFRNFRDLSCIVSSYDELPCGMSYKIHHLSDQKRTSDVTLYLITDMQGNPCNFQEEIKSYLPKKNPNHTIRPCTADNKYNYHKVKKYNLSDFEYRELADEFGSTIHHCRPKSETFPNEWPWWHHISRSWKDQTKRKKQYHTKSM